MLPPSVTLYATYFCQLKCSHCFLNQSGALNRYQLSLPEIINILDDAQRNNVFMMPISGGDPLLHENFDQIILETKSRNILPLLGITGIDISLDVAEKIKNLGVSCVQVSLDGINETKNSFYRGNSVFKNVITSVKNLKSVGIKVNIAFCIDSNNSSYIENLLELALILEVFKVKICFWESYGISSIKHSEVDLGSKYLIIQLCKNFECLNNKIDWIGIANPPEPYKPKIKYPPLVIGADGRLKIGEMGRVIGHINQELPSTAYTRYVLNQKNDFYHIFLSKRPKEILSVEFTNPEKIPCNALFYKDTNGYRIICRNDLSKNLEFFSILHEISHIELGISNKNPAHIDLSLEAKVNKHALEKLENYITDEFFSKCSDLTDISESELYSEISFNLDKNLVNYWEYKNVVEDSKYQ